MILGKYNQAKTVYFDLFQVDGVDFEPAASFATGDVKIMKDEGVEANTSNLPFDEGQGYSLVLTAAEMSAARIKIYVVDQTGTKVWLDTSVHVETYGNASAEHAFDLDTASTAQTADHTAAIADVPTVAEFNARTLATADYFDPAADTVATVTTVTGGATASALSTVDAVVDAIKAITDQFVFTVANLVDSNALAISDDTGAADNLELQYDGSGLTGDSFPATQAQVGNISSGSGGLSKIQDSFTNTDGGAETNTETDTETLNGTVHTIDDNVGNIDFYYEFDLGVNGAATAILWNGYIQSNGDTAAPQMYNWVGAAFEDVAAPIAGSNGTTVTEMSFPAPSKYTGTGANAGKVRFGFNSADATAIATDRVLCVFSSIAQQALVFNEGVAQSGGNNSIQLAAGSVGTKDQFQRARVILSGGTGAGQEAIITASTASTDTLTITPAWLTNPDATTVYEIIPGQTHSTIRNGGYDNGYVYLDVVNGASGTIIGVSGTTTNKSDNPADARTIADIENIRQFIISGGGAWSLDQAYTFWIFDHVSASLIDLNSQDITGSVFMRSGITGTGTATSTSVFELCGMLNVTVDVCNFLQCGFEGTTTLSSTDQYLAWHCFENSAITPIIDINGDGITTTTLNLVGYSGRIEIKGMTSVDVVVVAGDVHLTINADCTGGTLTYAGDVQLIDNSGASVTFVQGSIADILTDTAVIGAAGAGLTDLGGMSTAMLAEVNAEVDTALATTTYAEPGSIPAATASLEDKISYLYTLARNKLTQTATTSTLRNDADSGNIGSSTVSDDGTTATRGEWN